MSEKRISNETLGKVVVQVVKDLEKSLKTHEKTQTEQQAELKAITNKAVIQLRGELDRIESFSVDLKPLDEKMKNYINEIEKASEKAKKEFKTPMLEMKAIGIFAFVLLAFIGFAYLMNTQVKELKKERESKELFIEFIKADEKRIKEFNEWAKQ
ncbi:hypothetical protein [Myroides odoratimimus]|uniref:hypothetical protein n=1 Tax=Myroides odoratimimus TaxID=76832 RepID=UPI00217FF505|nr:hypothetical protein [Myroides odoratimimus]MCS7475153.1 hypothetical protein [Myroides odoratimimus]